MHPTKRPRVKICCIQNKDEAWLAIRYGASALGLVSEMPSGPGAIPDDRIRDIASAIPPGVSKFLLTAKTDPAAIIDQQHRLGVDTIQLCDRVEASAYGTLKTAMPGVKIVQVIHITGADALDNALSVAQHVDALLLDSGNPTASVKVLGGTGHLHDWMISRKIREAVQVPVFLAGGLNVDNVGEAIQRVGAYGIDVCTGLRMGNRLDERQVNAFFEVVQKN